jgi:hypothetical protein
MGTRGFIGIVIDGDVKISYNHYDSYPEGMGLSVLGWVTANRHALTCGTHRDVSGGPVDLARKLQVVSSDSVPTPAQIKRLTRFANLGVSEQSVNDWYCLLRECQGDIAATLEAGVIVDASAFPADSLFAEWGYIIDMDDPSGACLEVYRGFQHAPHTLGRFHAAPLPDAPHRTDPYYPVALCGAWSLNALPTGDEFVSLLNGTDDE